MNYKLTKILWLIFVAKGYRLKLIMVVKKKMFSWCCKNFHWIGLISYNQEKYFFLTKQPLIKKKIVYFKLNINQKTEKRGKKEGRAPKSELNLWWFQAFLKWPSSLKKIIISPLNHSYISSYHHFRQKRSKLLCVYVDMFW